MIVIVMEEINVKHMVKSFFSIIWSYLNRFFKIVFSPFASFILIIYGLFSGVFLVSTKISNDLNNKNNVNKLIHKTTKYINKVSKI